MQNEENKSDHSMTSFEDQDDASHNNRVNFGEQAESD